MSYVAGTSPYREWRLGLQVDESPSDAGLYLPLYKITDPVVSHDHTRYVLTNNGTIWLPRGRYFDSTSGHLITPSLPDFGQNWTIEAWAQADFTDSAWHEIYDQTTSRITFAINGNVFKVYDTAGRDSNYILSDTDIHQYVASQSASVISFFVDGKWQGSVASAGNSLGGETGYIGRYKPSAVEFWKGIINQLSLFKVAKNSSQIASMFLAGQSKFK